MDICGVNAGSRAQLLLSSLSVRSLSGCCSVMAEAALFSVVDGCFPAESKAHV